MSGKTCELSIHRERDRGVSQSIEACPNRSLTTFGFSFAASKERRANMTQIVEAQGCGKLGSSKVTYKVNYFEITLTSIFGWHRVSLANQQVCFCSRLTLWNNSNFDVQHQHSPY